MTWTLEEADCELWKAPPDPLLEQVVQLVTPEQPVWKGSAAELLQELEVETNPCGLVKRLNVRAGQLQSSFGIQYKNVRDRAGSHITFTLELQRV